MRIHRLHHAQLTIPPGSEDRARAFYCELLGLEEVAKPRSLAGRGGFWLQLGNAQVHVGVEPGADRASTKAHVAYEVVGLEGYRERLEAAGHPCADGVPFPGWSRFELRDPFGNRLEFLEATG
jgi:catechol 2,3-dioxygenase-like lactoylglutathione lyase family enzyme